MSCEPLNHGEQYYGQLRSQLFTQHIILTVIGESKSPNCELHSKVGGERSGSENHHYHSALPPLLHYCWLDLLLPVIVMPLLQLCSAMRIIEIDLLWFVITLDHQLIYTT